MTPSLEKRYAMNTPINKDHDAEYWRRKYEEERRAALEYRNALLYIFNTTGSDDLAPDDIVNDVEVEAYRALYE